MALVGLFCFLVFVGAMSFATWPADVSLHFFSLTGSVMWLGIFGVVILFVRLVLEVMKQ